MKEIASRSRRSLDTVLADLKLVERTPLRSERGPSTFGDLRARLHGKLNDHREESNESVRIVVAYPTGMPRLKDEVRQVIWARWCQWFDETFPKANIILAGPGDELFRGKNLVAKRSRELCELFESEVDNRFTGSDSGGRQPALQGPAHESTGPVRRARRGEEAAPAKPPLKAPQRTLTAPPRKATRPARGTSRGVPDGLGRPRCRAARKARSRGRRLSPVAEVRLRDHLGDGLGAESSVWGRDGGRGGVRTLERLPVTALAMLRLRPLGHPSASWRMQARGLGYPRGRGVG